MDCVFARRRLGPRIPKLADLFGSITTFRSNAFASISGSSYTNVDLNSYALEGETWYAFLFDGQNYAISRVDVGSSGVSLTSIYQNGNKAISLYGSNYPYRIRGSAGSYSQAIVVFKFDTKYKPDKIDYALTNCGKEIVKYRSGASSWATASTTRVLQSAVTTPGIVIAGFASVTSNGQAWWSVSNTATPLSVIKAGGNNEALNYTCLFAQTSSGNDYYVPTKNGTSFPSSNINSYTLLRFYEKW